MISNLILGATGVTGKLAVKIARLLGAARVVAAGRNQQALSALHEQGADAAISLALPETELSEAFLREAGQSGFRVVIDYVWGRPAEAFLAAITRGEFAVIKSETRFVQVGESAAPGGERQRVANLTTVPKPSGAGRTESLVFSNLPASRSAITRLLNRSTRCRLKKVVAKHTNPHKHWVFCLWRRGGDSNPRYTF